MTKAMVVVTPMQILIKSQPTPRLNNLHMAVHFREVVIRLMGVIK